MRKLPILFAAAAAVVLTSSPAMAVGDPDDIPPSPAKLTGAVTIEGLMRHERAFQRIAETNGNIRASGTNGYTASAAYVRSILTAAGYQVTEQTVPFDFFRELSPAVLRQVTPTPTTYQTLTLDYAGSGDVTGRVVPTNDIVVPPGPTPNSSNAGCEPADFAPASPTEPQVALVQRGTCSFTQKSANAQAAGYDAVVIFNEGQTGRTDLAPGRLFQPFTIPVVALSFADGAGLYAATQTGPTVVHAATSTENRPATTTNVIADTPGGDPSKVVVAGAHLDSVTTGPGINDNGSGVAALLEIAKQWSLLQIDSRQRVRFTFWGAEEVGSVGSQYYVDHLAPAELDAISAYLNFDMIGSPNFARFVYDGDGSEFGVPGPPGSGEIESVFNSYFAARNLTAAPTVFDFRSDYVAFFDAGIPVGGVFSGAEGRKTAAEAALFGGVAGAPYDACYHQACDNLGNVNTTVFAQLAKSTAYTILTLAMR